MARVHNSKSKITMAPKKKKKKKTNKEQLLAKGLKKVAPGIAGNEKTLKLLERLKIDPAKLVNLA